MHDPPRILIVDDNEANRDILTTRLATQGYDLSEAADGEEAVAAAKAVVYDAILMDVHMPKMDGLAATRAIRALEGPGGRAPIIAMSADVMPQSIERCRAAGMVDHVAKPVQIKALHEVLARKMAEQRRRNAA